MKKRFKLITTIASLCLAVALMAFGVYAAAVTDLKVTGTISFVSTELDGSWALKSVTLNGADKKPQTGTDLGSLTLKDGDIIVITSSVPISKWYVDNEDCLKEDLQQLYRRISCYVKVTKESVFVYEQGLNKLGMPNGVALSYENTLIQNQPKKENKFSFGNYFAELCPYSKTPFDNGIKKQATLFDDGELPY